MNLFGREVGEGRPLIVAEIGAAHNGGLGTAKDLISAARDAGADAVKIQCFTPDTITMRSSRPEFTIKDGPWKGWQLHDLYDHAHMPRAWFEPLYAHADEIEMPMFASVFSIEDLEFMEQFDPPAIKISSFELNDTHLITACSMKKRPMILSTGMATDQEVREAVRVASWDYDQVRPILLHCVSTYPMAVEAANMRMMPALGRIVRHFGMSDHSRGIEVAQIATALGACMIEKHITLTPDGAGLDDGFASGPEDFAAMMQAVDRAYRACWGSAASDTQHRPLRRSIYAVADIRPGDVFTSDNIRTMRPGDGLHPRFYSALLGRRCLVTIKAGEPIAQHMAEDMP